MLSSEDSTRLAVSGFPPVAEDVVCLLLLTLFKEPGDHTTSAATRNKQIPPRTAKAESKAQDMQASVKRPGKIEGLICSHRCAMVAYPLKRQENLERGPV